MIGTNVEMFDSPGHPTDPALRLAGALAQAKDVRPIRVENHDESAAEQPSSQALPSARAVSLPGVLSP
jgi:hypothetical protein